MIPSFFLRFARAFVVSAVLAATVLPSDSFAYQPGKDGMLAVAAVDTVVNQYTPLTVVAGTGATSLTVASTTGMTPGDVLMVYQAQGAVIDGTDTAAFGAVTAIGNAGHYEFVNVISVPSATQVDIASDCANGLRYGYDSNLAQVIRVPQYTTLTISGVGSIVAAPWNGSIGGVVAAFVQNAATIGGAGISVAGRGFRGGVVTNITGNPLTDWRYYRVTPAQQATQGGAEKVRASRVFRPSTTRRPTVGTDAARRRMAVVAATHTMPAVAAARTATAARRGTARAIRM